MTGSTATYHPLELSVPEQMCPFGFQSCGAAGSLTPSVMSHLGSPSDHESKKTDDSAELNAEASFIALLADPSER